jgi:transcriptional regulator with XRE-family HTH domain
MATIGREIHKARIDKGMNQKELADRLGMKQQYLSRIERDQVDVRVSSLRKIAAILGVSVSQLLGESRAAPAAVA